MTGVCLIFKELPTVPQSAYMNIHENWVASHACLKWQEQSLILVWGHLTGVSIHISVMAKTLMVLSYGRLYICFNEILFPIFASLLLACLLRVLRNIDIFRV